MQRFCVALNSLSSQSIALIVLMVGCAVYVFSVFKHVEIAFATGIVGLASGILTGHQISKTTTTQAGSSQETEPAQAPFQQPG